MLVPFTSLLTFPVVQNSDGGGDRQPLHAPASTSATTVVPPPSSHIVCTSTFPAPSNFLPWYHARNTLIAGGHVVWVGCTGEGEAHVRATLRKALATPHSVGVDHGLKRGSVQRSSSSSSTRLVYFDAIDSLATFSHDGETTGSTTNSGGTYGLPSRLNDSGFDARATLLRLQHRIEQVLTRLRTDENEGSGADTSEGESGGCDNSSGAVSTGKRHQQRPGTRPPVLVVLDDVAALAWSIDILSQSEAATATSINAANGDGKGDVQHSSQNDRDDEKEDPRIKVLRDKRKQGGTAVHQDITGHRLGVFIEERIRAETCEPHDAVLLTHLSANNTSIFAPQPRTPASRGGTYGVGTGFDADDAGEENEEEELYEEHLDDWMEEEDDDEAEGELAEAEGNRQTRARGQRAGDGNRRSTALSGVAAAGIDWRVDSVLRALIVQADVWIEIRGLRSGRARDCHGEICIYGLQRPCRARNLPLPVLPMPADPLSTLRTQDRAARPLNQLSRLSLAGAGASSISLRAWKIQVRCEKREAAMLFRIDTNGDAYAWSRGSKQQ